MLTQTLRHSAPSAETSARLRRKAAVLIVDDDPAVVVGLRRLLRDRFVVEGALDATQAADILFGRPEPFAAIVSDMRMPGLDGISFLAKVREHWPDTQRILLTGARERGVAIDAINQGQVFRFLQKPCPPDELRQTLEDAVSLFFRLRQIKTGQGASWQSNFYDELQTPLHNMAGLAQMIEEGGLSPDRIHKTARYVRETAQTMVHLIEAHQMLASLRAADAQLEAGRIAVADLIATLEARHARPLNQAGISFTVFAEPGLSVITSDMRLLVASLGGLVGSLAANLPPRSEISIRLARDSFEAATLIIEVTGREDGGLGGELEYVSRNASPARPVHLHSSLELTLAATFAEMHGGNLSMERLDGGHGQGFLRLGGAL